MSNPQINFGLIGSSGAKSIESALRSICSQNFEGLQSAKVYVAYFDEQIDLATIESIASTAPITIEPLQLSSNTTDANLDRCIAISAISNAVPNDANWLWLLDDTATLHSKFTLQKISNTLNEHVHSGVHLLHACEALTSLDTGRVEIDQLESMCEEYGFFTILGQLSTLVFRQAHLKFAFGEHFTKIVENASENKTYVSKFTYAQMAFLAMRSSEVAIVDQRLINVAADANTEAKKENDLEAYKLGADLVELSAALNGQKWSAHFFRYKENSLWVEMFRGQLKSLQGNENVWGTEAALHNHDWVKIVENWNHTLSVVDLIEDNHLKNALTDIVTSGVSLTLRCLEDPEENTKKLHDFLFGQTNSTEIYPSTVFQALQEIA